MKYIEEENLAYQYCRDFLAEISRNKSTKDKVTELFIYNEKNKFFIEMTFLNNRNIELEFKVIFTDIFMALNVFVKLYSFFPKAERAINTKFII